MDINAVFARFGLVPATRAALCAIPARSHLKASDRALRHMRAHQAAERRAKREAARRRADLEELAESLAH